MHLNIYSTVLVALPIALAGQSTYDFGYWDVKASRSWSASDHRSWSIEANYSGTPGLTKHSSWKHSPENGSDETTHDGNFRATYSYDEGGYGSYLPDLRMRLL